VVAKDGQTVVIGGLISDNTSQRKDKVPYLGDIPVLGNLFQFSDDRTNKINLLIFLTPHIIRDETEMAALASGERDRFKQFLQEHKAPPRWQEQLERPSFAPPPGERAEEPR
jgi:general secretion pathway protein D